MFARSRVRGYPDRFGTDRKSWVKICKLMEEMLGHLPNVFNSRHLSGG